MPPHEPGPARHGEIKCSFVSPAPEMQFLEGSGRNALLCYHQAWTSHGNEEVQHNLFPFSILIRQVTTIDTFRIYIDICIDSRVLWLASITILINTVIRSPPHCHQSELSRMWFALFLTCLRLLIVICSLQDERRVFGMTCEASRHQAAGPLPSLLGGSSLW